MRLALPHLTAADFAELNALTERCDAAFAEHGKDVAHTTSELNHGFHFHIYRAARSAVLIPIVESLWLQSGPYIRVAAQVHDVELTSSATHHHWGLIAALERRDTAAAVRALTDDITRSFNLIRRRLDTPEPADTRTAKYG